MTLAVCSDALFIMSMSPNQELSTCLCPKQAEGVVFSKKCASRTPAEIEFYVLWHLPKLEKSIYLRLEAQTTVQHIVAIHCTLVFVKEHIFLRKNKVLWI